MAGDPGFFDTAFRFVKGLARRSPAGQIASAAVGAFRRPTTVRQQIQPIATLGRFGPRQTGRATAILGRATVGMEGMEPRRRRMNVGNAKALRRAIRRTDGFVRLAKSALKNTGFKIVSKGSGRVSRAAMDKAVAAAHHKR